MENPFAVQGPFKYRIKGENYTLYSVGPDGEDNAGTPIDAPQYVEDAHVKQRYRITPKTRGNIVAGVNIP